MAVRSQVTGGSENGRQLGVLQTKFVFHGRQRIISFFSKPCFFHSLINPRKRSEPVFNFEVQTLPPHCTTTAETIWTRSYEYI